ncbi:hypothetical protein [Oceanibacterium hippocampi]|uniref:Uncharacterized protein n=1 Tax=Oceanibacterium hippocampi TaxID=745714 RepID=A0A1Y5TPV0_9PROT|nr:hypothetical protein [Oceanibacterium hippocampi]SLN69201.1 hypothetical protein OCH7691_03166 [Oceanibacterium hippocampi]
MLRFLTLFAVIGVFVVLIWSIRNDRAKPRERTTGLLGMRGGIDPEPEKPRHDRYGQN